MLGDDATLGWAQPQSVLMAVGGAVSLAPGEASLLSHTSLEGQPKQTTPWL